jgi:hypothetical protein
MFTKLPESALITACALAVAATALFHISPSDARGSTPRIVGTWLLTITPQNGPQSKILWQNTVDGTVIGLDSAPLRDTSSFHGFAIGSIGGGTWIHAGDNRFKTQGVSLVTDPHGRFAGLWRVQTTESIAGNTLRGRSVVTMSAPDGRITFRATSMFAGKRIVPPSD